MNFITLTLTVMKKMKIFTMMTLLKIMRNRWRKRLKRFLWIHLRYS